MAYEALAPGEPGWPTHWAKLEALAAWGFDVNPENRLCNGMAEVRRRKDEMAERRFQLPWDTDGLVVKVNGLDAQRRLGAASKFPRWAVAFKFPPAGGDHPGRSASGPRWGAPACSRRWWR